MVYSFEFYHRSGKKIIIEEIPRTPEDENFQIMFSLQKLIDEIESSPEPAAVYKFAM